MATVAPLTTPLEESLGKVRSLKCTGCPYIAVQERERERYNFIEINRKHDDTCTNKNYNEGLCTWIDPRRPALNKTLKIASTQATLMSIIIL